MQQVPNQTSDTPRLLLRGVDSLYVAYTADLINSAIDFTDLEYRKEKLQQDRKSGIEMVELGDECFALLPYGSNPYRYILSNKYFTIKLSERMQPTCYVQFHSEGLWQYGWKILTDRLRQWLASIDAREVGPESVSRCDTSFDYHIANPQLAHEMVLSRAVKRGAHFEFGTLQTLTIGRGQVVIRIYDKCAEIEQQSGKAFFHELWGRKDDVFRVEFQLRGERLRAGGIRTLDDLADHQGDVLSQIASAHTTLRLPAGDSNRSRWPLHPLWQAVQRDIRDLPRFGLVTAFDPAMALEYREYALCRSLYGFMKAFAAVGQLRRGETDEAQPLWVTMGRLERLFNEVGHNPIGWNQDVLDRMQKHELGQW